MWDGIDVKVEHRRQFATYLQDQDDCNTYQLFAFEMRE